MIKDRTIRVKGKSRVSVSPNRIRISITFNGKYEDYAETLRHSAEETEKLREDIRSVGFAGSDLKTMEFEVETEYDSYKERGVYKQRFAGYRYTHVTKLEFDLDHELLEKVLQILSKNPAGPEFSISYTTNGQDVIRKTLLERAMADAKVKAEILAKAAGVSLGSILNVDYSWGEIDFNVRPMGNVLRSRSCLAGNSEMIDSYRLDIEPDLIEAEDTVTVIWEIT